MEHAVPLSLSLAEQYRVEHCFSREAQITFDESVSILCADFYETMENTKDDTEVNASYGVFKEHLVKQFSLLVKQGFEFIDGKGKHEYVSSKELRQDLKSGRIIYRPTISEAFTFSEVSESHPMSEVFTIADETWIANDIFRIVHDFYGHGAGHSFSPQGEHYAWFEHRSMLPVEARTALFCETRGQSSWVNFGKHIRESMTYIPPAKRPFAPQKTGKVPKKLQ
jgi:hypothetical protein